MVAYGLGWVNFFPALCVNYSPAMTPFKINIDKERNYLGELPSIFSIIKKEQADNDEIIFDIDGNKIKIEVPSKTFEDYQSISKNLQLQPIIHATIIFPALIYTFENLRICCCENYEDNRWFRALRKTLAKSQIILDESVFEKYSSYSLAQRLLNSPVTKGIAGLVKLTEGEDDE